DFPGEDEFDRLFVNIEEGDYRLAVGSGRSGRVVPGADIGEVTRAARAAKDGVRLRSARIVPPERKAVPRIDRREPQ
ncbi:MAG TPA: hypothetical protein VK911_05900, partial [Vicinamibacterales bacterium]|nr:hypothetical protein [Vicinamibacterales bacterium]